jgi:type V secretory pathway adhesin AidA
MPIRFHRILNIIPGVRVNVSKGGLSTSVGPRGADINFGKRGVTTNAGLPGTGLSYRQTLGKPGSWIGIATFIVALALSAYRYSDKIAAYFSHPASAPATAAALVHPSRASTAAKAVEPAAAPAAGVRYVHRSNSNLYAEPRNGAPTLKKEDRGAQLTLLATAGKWSKVQDGALTSWMKTSVLGENPPD